MRRRLPVAAAVLLVLVGTDLASSSWTSAAAGTSGARAAVLAPPTGLSAVRSPTGVALAWSASVTPWAAGTRVLRSPTAGGALVEVASVTPAASGWTDVTAGAGTWHYAVAATAQSWAAATA